MNNCNHNIDIKIVNGVVVSYCTKCGAILNQSITENTIPCNSSISSSLPNNGGQILHD